ncbi:hypothetical protein ST45_10260 [Prevotella pectinovora]|uniref:hypothetical protein n=1 Tax=Prevotella pectinovora TaxID=1602169 RepID=UPI0005B6CA08|nr:hypothetical protein [Prevotella pectinovora]KIP60673.1 hypothetical protein ST45_10260 [Prevotella pectinovora]
MRTNDFTAKQTILGLVEVVRLEIESKKKTLTIGDEELVQKIMSKVSEANKEFTTEKEELRYWGIVTREVAWYEANTEESEEIINRLKSGDQLFAQKFFYSTNTNGCNISRFRSKILANIKQTYKIEVSVEEFGDILYTFLWNEGTWSILDKYSRKSSFFCWLSEVAQHELIRYLEDMKLINVTRERTAGNTRLLGLSIAPEMWEYILNDTMPNGLYKDVLFSTLVKRNTEEKMMKSFCLKKEDLHRLQKRAEADLKDRLIRSDRGYEELVLRDKTPRVIEVSEEFAKDFCVWQEGKSNANPLADVLGVDLNHEDLQKKVVDFLYTIPQKLKWTEEERIVWTLRFIEDTAPVEVAERIGRKRSWVDTKYSRLNVRFNKAVKEWWAENAK